MNREIKFRAWSKATEKMSDWGFIHSVRNLHKLMTLNHIELMQFTGLTDKNGKEIYEGDLLNIGATEFGFITNDKGENVAYEVRVEGCDYILYRTDLKLNWGRLSRLEEMNWNCQVVGNVHEAVSWGCR